MGILEGVRVMIIDDSNTTARAAEIFLKGKDAPTGCITKTMPDGFDAIKEIMEFQPHVILLDVEMKRVSGLVICRGIKQNPNLQHIKVVMVTGKEGLYARAKARSVGADGYVTKPFDRAPLIEVVRQQAEGLSINGQQDQKGA